MNWFEQCLTVEAVKTLYRELAKQHHPDLGGNTATMQEVNAQYHVRLSQLDGQESHDDEGRTHRYRYDQEREQGIMDKIQELLAVVPNGVMVALIGYWIWITGTEKDDTETRAKIKAAGCRWHRKRSCWYWRPAEMRHHGRQSRGSLSDLAMRYGCRVFDSESQQSRGPGRQTQLALA